MRVTKQSLRKIVKVLNNEEEDGGFWLPNIQRPFVWSEEQTCRLFDSIMREYPISTLLIWKTRAKIKCRKFIDNYKPSHSEKLSDFFVPENDKKKGLVLDGQQRLQSLFIGLCGSFDGRELYFNLLSGDATAPEDVKYEFAFRTSREPESRVPVQLRKSRPPAYWVKLKTLVFSLQNPLLEAQRLCHECLIPTDDTMKAKISNNVGQVVKTFHSDEGIVFQELDSIEAPSLYREDDVVEVFIRANSGGTVLSKSDLLFSLLSASWDQSNEEMEELLEDLNYSGFAFDRDFVLKACLVVLKKGARYEVGKFRDSGVREAIESKWTAISSAIKDVADRLRAETYIRCDKALPSYNVLMPLIYYRYHQHSRWDSTAGIGDYILRAALAGTFSATPDQLIDDMTNFLNEGEFDVDAIIDLMRTRGRPTELAEERLWAQGYGSKNIHLIFNLLYKNFNYTPLFDGNLPQIDHIFPQSALSKVKTINPSSGKKTLMRYKKPERDQLANCMLLTAAENGPRGKRDKLPCDWFASKPREYLAAHLIPEDERLWQIEKFDQFIEVRKGLIRDRLKDFLQTRPGG